MALLNRNQKIESQWPSYLFLFLAAIYFCHRLWGVYFPLEGDTLNNLYYQMNPELIASDYNPYQWEFMAGLPTGKNNPLLILLSEFWKLFHLSSLSKAIIVNMSAAFLSTYLLSVSGLLFLRWAKCSRVASCLGSVVCTYTGFHLVGIREFTVMFPLSFACVPPLFICYYEYCFGNRLKQNLLWASLLIGFSLLCGTNVPLFYYLPFFLMLPLFALRLAGKSSQILKLEYGLLLSVLGGLLVGAATWLPGMAFVGSMNRGEMQFIGNQPTLELLDKAISLFLHDWWRVRGWRIPWWNSQETSYFIGAPIVALLLVGIFKKNNPRSKAILIPSMVALLTTGFMITHLNYLPKGFEVPISWFYERLSIWHPTRFFMLMLLPIATFAAKGLDHSPTFLSRGIAVLVAIITIYFGSGFLIPMWEKMIPAMHLAAVLSLTAAFLALFLFVFIGERWSKLPSKIGILLSVYFMYAWAPIQTTSRNWDNLVHPEDFRVLPKASEFLGVAFNYGQIWEQARSLFIEGPHWMPSSSITKGRIFDEIASGIHGHYEAAQLKQAYSYSAVQDPANPKYLSELATPLSDALLDLDNACWKIKYLDPKKESGAALFHRPTCLEPAFLVPAVERLSSPQQTLRWTQTARREYFLQRVAINCLERGCPGVSEEAVSGQVRIEGNQTYTVSSSKPAILFLSIPYRWDWRAEVNGAESVVYRANHAFLAVAVPAGSSRVRLTLSKVVPNLAVGISMSSALIILVGILGLLGTGLGFRGEGAIHRWKQKLGRWKTNIPVMR